MRPALAAPSRSVVDVAAWSGVALAIWLLTLSSVSIGELLVAVPCAVACGVLAVAARRALDIVWGRPGRVAIWAVRLPAAVAADTARLLAVPWQRLAGRRADEGKLVRIAVAPGAESDNVSRRAAAIFLVSLTPGTYAVHDDSDTGEIVVHALVEGAPDVAATVTR